MRLGRRSLSLSALCTVSFLAVSTTASEMDEHSMMSALLGEARVALAQGQPGQALGLVLAAVRLQRGEAGVFDVLNQTREAHGLRRLPMPHQVHATQLPPGQQQQRLHAPQQRSGQQEESMMDDDDAASVYPSSSHAASPALSLDQSIAEATSGLDPADTIESLFRSLHVQQQPPPDQHHHQQQYQQQPHQPHPLHSQSFHGGVAPAAGTGSGWPGTAHPHAASAPPVLAPGSASHLPPITYPSLRTVLPALSASGTSSTRLELVHEQHHYAVAAAHAAHAAHVSSSPFPAAAAAAQSSSLLAPAAPLLVESGRDSLLDAAYDDAHNVICPQCAALIPQRRFGAHLQYWCQAKQG